MAGPVVINLSRLGYVFLDDSVYTVFAELAGLDQD